MPKIPTFTAKGRPTAEVGAVKSNIQIPLTQTIGTALAPVTKAVTDYAIKQKEISLELDELLKNSKKDEWEKVHSADKDSTTKAITYELDNGDEIGIYCYDWSVNNKYNFIDKLGVLIKSKEFNNWLNNEAYK